MQSIIVTRADAGRRIDKFLMKYLDAAPRSFIYKAFRKKNIKIDGKRAVGEEVLNEGDLIELFFSDETLDSLRKCGVQRQTDAHSGMSSRNKREQSALHQRKQLQVQELSDNDTHIQSAKPQKDKTRGIAHSGVTVGDRKALSAYCDIVYEDDELVLADKHYGVLSQKARNDDYSLNEALIDYCGVASAGSFTPSVVNRIDRNTTGLVCFARTYQVARELSRLIKEHETEKYYIAAVMGKVTELVHIEAWLKKDEKTNKVTIYEHETKGADHIETIYRPINEEEAKTLGRAEKNAYGSICGAEYTLLKVQIVTGRSHQIRAQLAVKDHAILGDPKYGDAALNKRLRQEYGIRGQLLHAWELSFPEPVGAPLEYLAGRSFRTKAPESFKALN